MTGVPDPLDLHHQGAERSIGVYLLETDDGLALQDCGPSTDVNALKAGLVEHGPGTAGYKEAIDTQQHRASHEWGTSPSDGQLQAVAGMG